jgi:hypothetical protein
VHHCSAGAGSRACPSRQPAQPLVLWGYDASPFVNLVKEKLSELELPYKQVGLVGVCCGAVVVELRLQRRPAPAALAADVLCVCAAPVACGMLACRRSRAPAAAPSAR